MVQIVVGASKAYRCYIFRSALWSTAQSIAALAVKRAERRVSTAPQTERVRLVHVVPGRLVHLERQRQWCRPVQTDGPLERRVAARATATAAASEGTFGHAVAPARLPPGSPGHAYSPQSTKGPCRRRHAARLGAPSILQISHFWPCWHTRCMGAFMGSNAASGSYASPKTESRGSERNRRAAFFAAATWSASSCASLCTTPRSRSSGLARWREDEGRREVFASSLRLPLSSYVHALRLYGLIHLLPDGAVIGDWVL